MRRVVCTGMNLERLSLATNGATSLAGAMSALWRASSLTSVRWSSLLKSLRDDLKQGSTCSSGSRCPDEGESLLESEKRLQRSNNSTGGRPSYGHTVHVSGRTFAWANNNSKSGRLLFVRTALEGRGPSGGEPAEGDVLLEVDWHNDRLVTDGLAKIDTKVDSYRLYHGEYRTKTKDEIHTLDGDYLTRALGHGGGYHATKVVGEFNVSVFAPGVVHVPQGAGRHAWVPIQPHSAAIWIKRKNLRFGSDEDMLTLRQQLATLFASEKGMPLTFSRHTYNDTFEVLQRDMYALPFGKRRPLAKRQSSR